MRYPRLTILLLALLISPLGAGAEHNPLLPRPQKVVYGTGYLAVRGLGIRFGSPPSVEDRFAAAELSRALKERTGIEVPILENQPRSPAIVLTRTGGVDPLPMPDEQPGPDSREAYLLKVTPAGAEIRGRSSAAVLYGVQTIRQLVEREEGQAFLPEVEIDDWPSLAYRGTMVDVGSEGLMSTEEEIKRQLDFLARWKANQYYFYNEDTIELAGYPLLNPEGRFTKDQVRRIIAYGRERHIDVVPYVELYGHQHDLFRIEKYSDLADFPYMGEFKVGNPKAEALLSDWAEQFTQLFPSAFFHVGFDESWQIEEAAKQQGAGATPVKLFMGQLNFVANLFQRRGKRVMFNSDMLTHIPSIGAAQLPPGVIPTVWYYDPSPDPEYKKWLAPVVEKGVPFFVVTEVGNTWRLITPDYERGFKNIDTFLAVGRKFKTLGLMNTLWTDPIAGQGLYRQCWPGIAYGAIASWQSTPVDRSQFFLDYARQMYGSTIAPLVARALEDLARSETDLQKVLGANTTQAMWDNPFTPYRQKAARDHQEDLRQVRLLAEDAEEHLYEALSLEGDRTTLDSLLLGSRMLDYTGMKYVYAAQMADAWQHLRQQKERPGPELVGNFQARFIGGGHTWTADLMDGITELRPIYRANWLAEYTPYRLGRAMGQWDAEYQYWLQVQYQFQAFAREYKPGEPLPPFDSIVKPCQQSIPCAATGRVP